MAVIAEVTIVPLGTATTSVSSYVAACHRVLQEAKEIRYQLTPMSTIIEGELTDVLDIVQKMHQVPFDEGAQRVSTTIRIDDRRDKALTMEGKVSAVVKRIEKK
ncbi:MTH1187 family thiamine-binding protein [Heliorestis acidaminivorans]|uniref:MTH1187 family thiamine-binding protein n=1 Tax=Heliorestis acidaminivorans TaxID=553427 RepID=A0A6I0F1J3_9FIRM|nr:MTH1187 family thiamine-binding protein [Heliorestis acidaminivorans]KAB2953801.1 MTH1187 family thiamine-binding protein [Heliorestis acidaminivorans]